MEYITVKEAKARGILSPEVGAYVPDICPEKDMGCGQDLYITINRKKLVCKNTRCGIKTIARMADMLEALGLKGYGYSFCEKYYKYKRPTTHLAILLAPYKDFIGAGHNVLASKFVYDRKRVRQLEWYFPDILASLCLPGISYNTANKCFKYFVSLEHLEKFLELKGETLYEYLIRQQGVSKITANNIVEQFKIFNPEIRTISKIFRVIPMPRRIINVVMTNPPLYKNYSKDLFVLYCNMISKGFIKIIRSSAVQSCDYVLVQKRLESNYINDVYPVGTAKYEAGMERQHLKEQKYKDEGLEFKEEDKVVVTPDWFVTYLEREVERYEREQYKDK